MRGDQIDHENAKTVLWLKLPKLQLVDVAFERVAEDTEDYLVFAYLPNIVRKVPHDHFVEVDV